MPRAKAPKQSRKLKPGRKPALPDATEYDAQRERLWQWLLAHGGATVASPCYETRASQERRNAGEPNCKPEYDEALARRIEPQRILGESQNQPDPYNTRRNAVAGALLWLDAAAGERADDARRYYLDAGGMIGARASEALRAVKIVEALLPELRERAERDCAPMSPISVKWPLDMVSALETAIETARNALLVVAAAAELPSAHTAGSMPNKLNALNDAFLKLDGAGFNNSEIARLLDTYIWDRTGPPPLDAIDRVKARIKEARAAIGGSSKVNM